MSKKPKDIIKQKSKGLFDLYDEETYPDAKTPEVLAMAKDIRRDMLNKYGIIPTSILVNDRSDRAIDLEVDGGRDYSTMAVKELSKKMPTDKMSLKEIRAYDVSHRGATKGALSRFPQNIGRILLNFYCPEGGTCYDPFAGHVSRLQLAFEAERHYIGVDISAKFMEGNRKVREFLLKRPSLLKDKPSITLIEGSSDKVDVPDECADFTITSPPYWATEWYGDEPEQLGIKSKTYEQFLENLKGHIKENYRILKKDTFCIWNVNDFVKNGKFYPYHIDVVNLFQEVGFELFTIYIADLGQPIGQAFPQSIMKSKRFPKRHEYFLVFKKP